MKKRILSFLMACFMVASTFIISRPLVDVHAAETDETTKWTMDPGAFYTGNGIDGPFQIGAFNGTGGVFKNISGWVPVWNQTKWGQSDIPAASADKWSRQHAWVAYECFAYDKDAGPDLRVNPITFAKSDHTGTVSGFELAVAFTAPADGFYSYKEVVHSLGKNADGTGTKQVIFKVKKSKTEEINTTNPVLEEDFNGTLKGIIELTAGDVIYFTANVYGTPTITSADNYYCGAGIDELVIEKLNDEDIKTYEFSSDVTGAVCGTDNAFTLRGYNHVTGEFLDNLTYADGIAYVTGISSTESKFFWLTGDNLDKVRMLPLNAGYDYSSVIEFTAPKAGEYFFDAQFFKEWDYNANTPARFSNDFLIVNSDMEVLNRNTTYDPVYEANSGTRHGLTFNIGHSVYLNKGESVYLMTRVNENATSCSEPTSGARIEYLNVIRGSVHPCSAETLTQVPYTAPDCVTAGNEEHWKCSCGEIYADAEATTVYEGEIEIPVDEDAHAPATEWTTDEVGHWYVCNNGCDEKLSYGEHDWTNGVCGTCELACPAHDMNNAEGKCATCGMTHEHAWTDGVCDTCGYECQHTGGTATCATRAMCEVCDSYYGDTVANNHEREGKWVDDVDGCYLYYGCCYTSEPVQDHVYDDDADMTCNHCGYDRTVVVAEDNFGEVFESVFTDGATTDHVAQGPAEGALNNSGAVKGEAVTGFTYRGFNLEMISSTSNIVKLRHHILLADGLTVKVDGEAVALENVSGNYYYFEVEVEVGQFGTAHVITVEGTTVVTASVHSYMKTAFESGTLTAEQTNLLNALYDWDYAVANAN